MPTITLPDGNNIDFPKKVTGLEVAEKISKSLAKQAMIISVNGELKDLDFVIEKNCSVKIFTSKNAEGLETIRHDTAHILAMAVQELFPGTQVTIGPVIENGFYYDFARKEPFTEDDLKSIEVKMREIVDRNVKTKREVWNRDKAIKHFREKGETYKAELIESIPPGEEVSIYFHGEWHDLWMILTLAICVFVMANLGAKFGFKLKDKTIISTFLVVVSVVFIRYCIDLSGYLM